MTFRKILRKSLIYRWIRWLLLLLLLYSLSWIKKTPVPSCRPLEPVLCDAIPVQCRLHPTEAPEASIPTRIKGPGLSNNFGERPGNGMDLTNNSLCAWNFLILNRNSEWVNTHVVLKQQAFLHDCIVTTVSDEYSSRDSSHISRCALWIRRIWSKLSL